MLVYNKKILSASALNTSVTSEAQQLLNMYGYAMQVSVTGTPNGIFRLQGSADSTGITPVNWSDISSSAYTITAAGTFLWNAYDVMYNWVRITYTDLSGGTSTATVDCTFNGKGV